MPSIQKIVVSLAFAASVFAQTQIADGQVQQITDGQVQAVTATPVKQITDGQIQAVTTVAPTVAPVAQITDGQIQAVTVTPVKQITDGQIQAVTTLASVSTGVPSPSANGTFTAPAPSAFKGAANIVGWSQELAVAAIGAAAGFAML